MLLQNKFGSRIEVGRYSWHLNWAFNMAIMVREIMSFSITLMSWKCRCGEWHTNLSKLMRILTDLKGYTSARIVIKEKQLGLIGYFKIKANYPKARNWLAIGCFLKKQAPMEGWRKKSGENRHHGNSVGFDLLHSRDRHTEAFNHSTVQDLW